MSARIWRLGLFGLALCLLLVSGASADEMVGGSTVDVASPDLSLYFKTFFLYQNDRDFDRSEPLYDENGQSVGYITTLLEPAVTWDPIGRVRLRYGARIESVWSRNNPEPSEANEENTAVWQHREIWGEFSFTKDLSLRSGYWKVYDPTHMFIERYMGAFELTYNFDRAFVSLVFGQLPDAVYETTAADTQASELQMNNFENDAFLAGFTLNALIGAHLNLKPSVFMLYDNSEIDRPKTIVNPSLSVVASSGQTYLLTDLAMQFGSYKRGGLNNHDVSYLAGAGQVQLWHRFDHFRPRASVVFISADDGDRYDQYDTGYLYSGKSLSSTMMLTENWLYDQYDNLDERAAAQGAGLGLIDVDLSLLPVESLDIFVTYGYGRVLDTTNLDDDPTIGHEVDLGVFWQAVMHRVGFSLVGGGLFPGGSGARLQNEIDLEARDPIYHLQGAMTLSF
ncbi:MAG: hypothetical protein ACTSXZ_09320 [Alphaproteobacteria bacterium]